MKGAICAKHFSYFFRNWKKALGVTKLGHEVASQWKGMFSENVQYDKTSHKTLSREVDLISQLSIGRYQFKNRVIKKIPSIHIIPEVAIHTLDSTKKDLPSVDK